MTKMHHTKSCVKKNNQIKKIQIKASSIFLPCASKTNTHASRIMNFEAVVLSF